MRFASKSGDEALATLRREFVARPCLSLNFGLLPASVAESVAAAGVEFGINRAEIERLIGEIERCDKSTSSRRRSTVCGRCRPPRP